MASFKLSAKRLQMENSQNFMMTVIAVAVFVTVMSLAISKSLWSQRAYQQRVINKKEAARDQLKKNLDAVDSLATAYKDFIGSPDNVLGGNPAGSGDRDGDNAKLVLDALPSKYDFPAVATSLEKILTDKNFKITGITGTDDEKAQEANQTSGSPTPQIIPFSFSIGSSYGAVQGLFTDLEHSIRPFSIQEISFSGNDNDLKTEVKAKTYYQPEKNLDFKTEVVK